MAFLTKEQMLVEMTLKKETVELATGSVIVSEASAEDYMKAYSSDLSKDENGEFSGVKFTSLLAVRSILGEDGKRMFADEEAETLRTSSSAFFTKIVAAIKRLNGLTEAEAKNSEASPS